MSLYVAGGYGEHGRNCFLIQSEDYNIMIDCGIMNGSANPYPRLSVKQIQNTRYLFITHSHIDHTGALPYLYESGFRGTVYLSKHTYNQMQFKPKKYKLLEIVSSQWQKLYDIDDKTKFCWGKSGHCLGAVWYLIENTQKRYLFTGDYCEHSLAYRCDTIRNVRADVAVVDCAYGKSNLNAGKCIQNFMLEINKICSEYSKILLPVPKYGRGTDIYTLIKKQRDDIFLSVDEDILKIMFSLKDKEWLVPGSDNITSEQNKKNRYLSEIIIICDAQLKLEKSRNLANEIISEEGMIVFSGNLDKNSFAEELYTCEKARFIRYPVHQNYDEAQDLVMHNDFKEVYYVHSKEKLEVHYEANL